MNTGTLIFLHIPKAGGTTLLKTIGRHFPRSSRLHLYGDPDVLGVVSGFRALPRRQREKIRFLAGHSCAGLHDSVSAPATYYTMLREPTERVISHYHYVKRRKDHYLHRTVVDAGMSLTEYAKGKLTWEVRNAQCRLLSAITRPESIGDDEGSWVLDEAKSNIDRYFISVGIMERFDESLLLLARLLGWSWMFYSKDNVAQGRKAVDAAAVKTIEANNALDIELHKYAVERLERQLATAGLGRTSLSAYKLANRLVGPIFGISKWRLAKKLQKLVHR